MKKATLVLGASMHEYRYSYKAIQRLRANDIPVLAIGLREGKVADVSIEVGFQNFKNIDTVTLYLNPKRQKMYYDYILNLEPRRVIFNPGTENPEFINKLKEKGILTEQACTLVLLAGKRY